MMTTSMGELQVGWWGGFDPVYGPERVLMKREYTLPNGVDCVHLQVWDGRSESSSPYVPRGTGRFIVRAASEPVLALTFPEALAGGETA